MSAIQWKLKKILLAFLAFVMIASAGTAAILMNSGRSYAATGSLLYRLEFADEENMFANTAARSMQMPQRRKVTAFRLHPLAEEPV